MKKKEKKNISLRISSQAMFMNMTLSHQVKLKRREKIEEDILEVQQHILDQHVSKFCLFFYKSLLIKRILMSGKSSKNSGAMSFHINIFLLFLFQSYIWYVWGWGSIQRKKGKASNSKKRTWL